MTSDQEHGSAHRHDRRVCWDCLGVFVAALSVSQDITDRTALAMGWRYLEPRGRMICPDCRQERRRISQTPY